MESLLELLIPLLFIVIILIINVLARVKEAQQKGPEGRKPRASPWTRLASQQQIRKFLEEAARGGPARGGGESRQPTRERPETYGGPSGMPAGRVTPTARREAPSAERPAARTAGRDERHIRKPPPPPKAAHVPVEKRHRKPRVKSRKATTEKRKFRGGLERRLREREAARPQPAAVPGISVEASAIGEGEMTRPGGEQRAAAKLLPDFKRRSLRRAIVMSEVLGAPVGLRPPRA